MHWTNFFFFKSWRLTKVKCNYENCPWLCHCAQQPLTQNQGDCMEEKRISMVFIQEEDCTSFYKGSTCIQTGLIIPVNKGPMPKPSVIISQSSWVLGVLAQIFGPNTLVTIALYSAFSGHLVQRCWTRTWTAFREALSSFAAIWLNVGDMQDIIIIIIEPGGTNMHQKWDPAIASSLKRDEKYFGWCQMLPE